MMTTEQVIRAMETKDIYHGVFTNVFKSDSTPENSWLQCKQHGWLIGVAAQTGVSARKLVLISCEFAKLVLHFVPKDEDGPREIIEFLERWGNGTIFTPLELGVLYSVAAEIERDAQESNDIKFDRAALCVYHCAHAAIGISMLSVLNSVTSAGNVLIDSALISSNDICDIIRKHLPWSVIEEHLLKDT